MKKICENCIFFTEINKEYGFGLCKEIIKGFEYSIIEKNTLMNVTVKRNFCCMYFVLNKTFFIEKN